MSFLLSDNSDRLATYQVLPKYLSSPVAEPGLRTREE
jgi:hypothetical protein